MEYTWNKRHHTEDDGATYTHFDKKVEAVIAGSGKNWKWHVTLWRIGYFTLLAEQSGEAVSAQSAKDDVMRWVKEADAEHPQTDDGELLTGKADGNAD